MKGAHDKIGLVLTAGGARGAYQAGVLRRIGEVRSLQRGISPFPIIAGASAGAINGAMLAATGSRFGESTMKLAELWSELEMHHVFHSDALSLGRTGLQWARDLALGGLIGGGTTHSLLDASPLRTFLSDHLPLRGIENAVRRGHLYAIAISATSYHSGRSFIFIHGQKGHPIWTKSRRVCMSVRLRVDHILASAAIPIIFQPVKVNTGQADCYFGDGGLRLVAPLSPAIRLGAQRVMAIGIRCTRSADALSHAELRGRALGEANAIDAPPIGQICGVFLNAIFLDHLDADLDHLIRMNELVGAHAGPVQSISEPMRTIEPLIINPSEDFALIAKNYAHKMPRALRYVLDGLGKPDEQSADLMSYLLFDSDYTKALIEVGYLDAHRRIDEIEAFLRDKPQAVRRKAS
jgi:NTE family protein